jgi:O-antigen/teichoic acid export membrane protein
LAAQSETIDALSTEHLQKDLKGRSVRGGVFTVGSQATTFLIQTAATVFLARLLTPADFGLVAMVTAITGLGQAFADIGLSEATIQCKELNYRQVSNLFWINTAVGLALTLITMGLAPVLAWFYHQPRLENIALVLSLTFLVGGLRVQHDALLKRQMRFSALAGRDIASYLIAIPVAIMMAWRGAGYWALVALPMVLNSTQMVLSWLIVRWIPSLPRRGAQVRSMISFGGNVAASNVLLNIIGNADNVLIGRYLGAASLGLYSRAYNLLMLPARQLNAPIGNVAIPALSRLDVDPERFARYYLRAINLMIWISAPLFGFLFVAAEPVVVIVLGNQWRGAAPVFRFLAIAGLAHVIHGSTIWLFVSRGQSGNLLKVTAVISPVLLGSYLIGLRFGINGVALTGSLALIGVLPWMLSYTLRGTRLTVGQVGRAMLYPSSVCLTAVCFGEFALRLVAPQNMLAQLMVAAVAFLVAFTLGLLVPAIRTEVVSLRNLFGELRFSPSA